MQGFSEILNRFDSQLRLSMTFDQGSEMRHHQRLTQSTGVKVYFAHPHSPWERGINENVNGLLRQYLPKGTDLSVHSQEHLDQIALQLNVRIRKSLGWKAPAELFLPEGAFDFVQYWSKPNQPFLLPNIAARRAIEKLEANSASNFPTAPTAEKLYLKHCTWNLSPPCPISRVLCEMWVFALARRFFRTGNGAVSNPLQTL